MKQLLRSIRTYILIGGVMVTPVAVTLWVFLLLVNLFSSSKLTRWLITPIFNPEPGQDLTTPQALVSLGMDLIMEKTPVINKIYMFVRTVSESILAQKETMFQKVVLIEYPHPGAHAIAFISANVPPALQQKCNVPDDPHVFVFLPTTPNPTSGFLLALPASKVKPLDISTADAMRLIVSAGASTPDAGNGAERNPSLLDKIDHMVLSQRRAKKLPPDPQANLNFPEPEEEE
jgi:uncharacterized membrane protein